MRAARIRSGRTHYIVGERTYCGRHLIDMPVSQELEAAALPAGEAVCVPCAEIAASGIVPEPTDKVILPPSHGVLRRTGPLYHGLASKRGEQLR